MPNELTPDKLERFLFAGNAYLTIKGNATGKWFTYRVKRCKTNDNCYFVTRLSGNDNTDVKSYVYIGVVYNDTRCFVPVLPYKNMLTTDWPLSIQVFRWLINHFVDYNTKMTVYHNGKCGHCGRMLTTPESIERGIGPECWKILGGK